MIGKLKFSSIFKYFLNFNFLTKNRFDEVYTTRRRLRLQEYIRAIIRIPIIVERSFALQQFLEINKTLLNTPGRHSQEEFSESVDGGRISFFDTINEDE